MKKRIVFFLFSFFVCYISHAQSWMWGKNGIGEGYGAGVAADGYGNCYFSGSFRNQDTLSFSGTKIFNPENKPGGASMFLVKYDRNGKVKWVAHSINYSNTDIGNGLKVALDEKNNSYVTANYIDTLILGTYTFKFPVKYLESNCYLVKYDSNGILRYCDGKRAGKPVGGKSHPVRR